MNKVDGIKIRDIEISLPKTMRDNDYYEEKFGDKGFFARMMAEDNFGRDKKYVVDPDMGENATTLAIQASKNVLNKTGLLGKDIDLICFVSFTPEFMSPIGAIAIHKEIDARKDTFCYDLNANCVGMVFAFEQISKYMTAATGINRVLLVAAECMSHVFSPDDMASQVCYGDAGCAMIIEKTNEEGYLVDTRFCVSNEFMECSKAPICGLSNIFTVPKEELYYSFVPPEVDVSQNVATVKSMLEEHNLKVSDIALFATSQFAKPMALEFIKLVGATEEQMEFVGDKYGYTGASSPFLSIYEAVKKGKVKRGDLVVVWTIGAGKQDIMTLLRY